MVDSLARNVVGGAVAMTVALVASCGGGGSHPAAKVDFGLDASASGAGSGTGNGPGSSPDAAPDAVTGAATDGGAGACPAQDAGLLEIGASKGTLAVSIDVSLDGAGFHDLGAIAISHGVGTIQYRGETASAFVFDGPPMATGPSDDGGAYASDRDYEIVAVSADRLIAAWITCTGTRLTFVYYESTDGSASGTELPATGTCAVSATSVAEAVTLPAVTLAPPCLVPGFTITGSQLSFDGAHPGQLTYGGAAWSLYPFHEVDCSSCATPGWYELHSLLWKEAGQSACLGILYLQQGSPASVELGYLLCLPGVDNPLGAYGYEFQATWTAP